MLLFFTCMTLPGASSKWFWSSVDAKIQTSLNEHHVLLKQQSFQVPSTISRAFFAKRFRVLLDVTLLMNIPP
jgi:hypothetical protein